VVLYYEIKDRPHTTRLYLSPTPKKRCFPFFCFVFRRSPALFFKNPSLYKHARGPGAFFRPPQPRPHPPRPNTGTQKGRPPIRHSVLATPYHTQPPKIGVAFILCSPRPRARMLPPPPPGGVLGGGAPPPPPNCACRKRRPLKLQCRPFRFAQHTAWGGKRKNLRFSEIGLTP